LIHPLSFETSQKFASLLVLPFWWRFLFAEDTLPVDRISGYEPRLQGKWFRGQEV
jgi:hypothetical protein